MFAAYDITDASNPKFIKEFTFYNKGTHEEFASTDISSSGSATDQVWNFVEGGIGTWKLKNKTWEQDKLSFKTTKFTTKGVQINWVDATGDVKQITTSGAAIDKLYYTLDGGTGVAEICTLVGTTNAVNGYYFVTLFDNATLASATKAANYIFEITTL